MNTAYLLLLLKTDGLMAVETWMMRSFIMKRAAWIFGLAGIWMIMTAKVSGSIHRVPSEYPTIQQGIDAAESGDSVLVADGLYRGWWNRDLDFTGKTITVCSESDNPDLCIIDCEGSAEIWRRGFYLHSGEDENAVIRGFTVRRGYAGLNGGNCDGGGILCINSSPTIINCKLTANTSECSGGGICFRDNSNAYMENCVITVNAGNGICCYESSPIIENCIVTDNTIAGIRCLNDTCPVITHCIISRNWQGIYCLEASPVIQACLISDNIWNPTRDGFPNHGSGIYCKYSSPIITNCIISGNSAERGGGINCDRSELVIGGGPDLGNCFIDNTAGAGMDLFCVDSPLVQASYNSFSGYPLSDYYVSPQTGFDLSGCIGELTPLSRDVYVSPDGSDDNDGLSWPTSFLTIQHALSVLAGSDANPLTIHIASGTYSPSLTGERYPLNLVPNVSLTGMGIEETILDAESSSGIMYSCFDEDLTISNMTLTGGYSQDGGGIQCYYTPATLMISDCNFTGNTAWSMGGGMASFLHSDPTIINCVFTENTSLYGGGLYCFLTSSPAVTNCVFQGNTAKYGGGLGCYANSSPILEGVIVRFNSSVSDDYYALGGGIQCDGGAPAIRRCVITENTASAPHAFGGGIYCKYTSAFITDCTISGNTSDHGGGIYCDHGSPDIISCNVIGNQCEIGGGMYFDYSSPSIINSAIASNTASYRAGGIMILWDSFPILTNCTLTGNSAEEGGGLFCLSRSDPMLTNCILWNDTPDEVSSLNTILINYSDVDGAYPGEGNIDADPMFITGYGGDYYLSQTECGQYADSPCLDSGNDLAETICFQMSFGQVCMDELTTCSEEMIDTGIVDMGVHYFPSSYQTPTPFPTETPGPNPTNTPFPQLTETPVETCSPTSTPTAAFTIPPTESPVCSELGVKLWMPSHYFYPGAPCGCKVLACNPGPESFLSTPLFVVLEIYGIYYFAPSFNDFDYYLFDLPPGQSEKTIWEMFSWPDVAGEADGITLYAAMTDSSISEVFGEYDVWTFGWGFQPGS
ncbi:right-handed parallel beta-helix repeat-containing protein [bacterium]|nr:right-handed parallel beta-helix repeat-containing protein [candidate division CSSED10-310 bacterium]